MAEEAASQLDPEDQGYSLGGLEEMQAAQDMVFQEDLVPQVTTAPVEVAVVQAVQAVQAAIQEMRVQEVQVEQQRLAARQFFTPAVAAVACMKTVIQAGMLATAALVAAAQADLIIIMHLVGKIQQAVHRVLQCLDNGLPVAAAVVAAGTMPISKAVKAAPGL